MADATGDRGPAGTGRGGRPGRGSALRRYPALVWLIGAGLLALLLPSGLTLPQSGPSTLAEYAPVPGAGEGSADLGELASAESAGVGSGSGKGERAGVAEPEEQEQRRGGRFVRKAGTKRCVGDPPRQTEDPLSPPCIAFFDGDNGGATAKGVTADEVVVTAVMESSSSDQRKGEDFDCAEAPAPEDETWQDTLCKAYMRYFNDRYQTYNRTVRLHSLHYGNATTIDETFDPFAHLGVGASGAFSKRNIVSVGYGGQPRRMYSEHAPYLITFQPDTEDDDRLSASFICQRLEGHPARHAGDPLLRDDLRRFGYWADNAELNQFDRGLLAELKRQCAIDPVVVGGIGDTTAAARLRAADVTTVIINVGNSSHAVITQQANTAAFRPEWVFPSLGLRSIGTNFYGRLAEQSQWANAFGITVDYRRGDFTDQMWYRAYKEGCPSCPEPQLGRDQGVSNAAAIYDAFTMLFYGIQSAGPRLTPENIDRGLHAIPPRASSDPFLPAAYFAPGNWSFVKDATTIWWDPTGIAPGASANGCYRLANGGLRYRAGEWPQDDDIRADGPCQGDTFPGG